MNEEDKIIIKNNDGIEQEFYKLIEFTDKNTNKNFIIYTDNKFDENNKLNIYSNIVEKNNDDINFIPVTAEEDLETVKKALVQVKVDLN